MQAYSTIECPSLISRSLIIAPLVSVDSLRVSLSVMTAQPAEIFRADCWCSSYAILMTRLNIENVVV